MAQGMPEREEPRVLISLSGNRFRAIKEHQDVFERFSSEIQGQNLALDIMYVPDSLDSDFELTNREAQSQCMNCGRIGSNNVHSRFWVISPPPGLVPGVGFRVPSSGFQVMSVGVPGVVRRLSGAGSTGGRWALAPARLRVSGVGCRDAGYRFRGSGETYPVARGSCPGLLPRAQAQGSWSFLAKEWPRPRPVS